MTADSADNEFQMLKEKVIAAIAKQKSIPEDVITMESTFEDLNVDSLDALEILFELEDDLDVDIPDTAARALRNVGEVVEGLVKLRAGEEIEIPEAEETEAGPAVGSEPDARPSVSES